MGRKKSQDIITPFLADLHVRLQETIARRRAIEGRWLDDLDQYRGEDASAPQEGRSRVVLNLTRAKAQQAEARLIEMLFPSSDRNWSIEPTPIPSLATQGKLREDMQQALYEEAHKRAQKMQARIDDLLTEARYVDEGHKVIHDGILYGTGVLKGPVLVNKYRRTWKKVDDGTAQIRTLEITAEPTVSVSHVPLFDFYPDLTARTMEDAEYVFERRVVHARTLAELALRPGYKPERIRQALTQEPARTLFSPMPQDADLLYPKHRYELWTYYGPASPEVLNALGVKDDLLQPLSTAIVQFVGDVIIRAEINPIDTERLPFHVFVYEPDEFTLFGYGLPWLLRHPQRIINATWRAMLENAAMSSAPQLVVNRMGVEPADGSWELRPRKVWYVTDPTIPANAAIVPIATEAYQGQFLQLYQAIRQILDDELNLPTLLPQGQGGVPETATGVSLMLQSFNIYLKRIAKAYDAGVTQPLIQALYDYFMQYDDDESIKGDYQVKVRGSEALLLREGRIQAMQSLMQLAAHPALGQALRPYEVLRRYAEDLHLPVADLMVPQSEYEQRLQSLAQAPTKEVVEQQRMQMEAQEKAAALELKKAITQMRYEIEQLKQMVKLKQTELQVQGSIVKEQMKRGAP